MPTDSPSTSEATFNVDLRGVHYDFLKERVPRWFMEGSTQRQEELGKLEMEMPAWYLAAAPQAKADMAARHDRFRETLNTIENRLGNIEDVLTFAEQPLKDAIKARFNLELDVRNVFFARKYAPAGGRSDFYGALVLDTTSDLTPSHRYRGISLLEAALANFEADEEQPSACDTCEIITTWNTDNSDVLPTFSAVKAQAVAITPTAFAKLCRSLDLGKRYQAHIQSVVTPQGDDERVALAQQLQAFHQQQFALSVEIAWMQAQGRISAQVYSLLKQLALGQGENLTLDGKPVTCAALNIFGSLLVGPLLIGPDRQSSERIERVVVYIPNDPQQPIKEYASSADFMADIRQRLHSASYRRFFSRFVPQREQGRFFSQFNQLFRPANGSATGGDYPLQPGLARLPITDVAIAGNLWERLVQAHTRKILSDARAVAVPTEDEDRKTRMARLESFFEAAVSVFNLAAFVVPGLAPIMLAVGASQMCYEVYEGIEAYERGELKQMWGHFASVALNVAFIATGAKVLPAIKWQSAVDHLKPVTLESGKQVLWKPDLGAYESPVKPTPAATPDALGLYAEDGQQWVEIEGKHYRVKQDDDTGQYRIQHPSRPDAYAPELEHNHKGVWTHELEEPLTWDEATLHKRLGLTEQADPVRISGVGADTLRRVVVDNEPLPLLLDDTITRFKLHQQLSTFVEQLRSSDPLVHMKADPALQLDTLQRRGLLPANAPLKVIGPQGAILWETPNAPLALRRRVVVLTERAMAGGHFLREVLYTLQGVDPQLKEFPGSAEESLEVRAGKLRQYIAEAVDGLKGPLLEERYRAQALTPTADVQRVLDAYPALPTPAAVALLQGANVDELQAFRSSGRLPERLAAQAKWCEQETRVARAYEALHFDTQGHLDSQRLALRTLETLPGWHRGARVELRQYSVQGELLDAIGAPDATSKRSLVVMDGCQFQGSQPGDFYTAIWEQLALDERQRMGLNSAAQLQQAIQRAPLPRDALRTVLEDNPVRKPAYDPMVRLMGGAPGVAQMLKSARNRLRSPEERVHKLFTSFDEGQIKAFIQTLGEDVQRGLAGWERQRTQLKKALRKWQRGKGRVGMALDGPYVRIANKIMRCWSRETGATLTLSSNDNVHLVDLPPIQADFSHVATLELSGITWSEGTGAAFLENFTHVNSLSLIKVGLTELPPVIGEMSKLTSLNLRANTLRLTAHSAAKLSQLSALEVLDLSENPLGEVPDFSGMAQLRELRLNWTRIERWPSGLRTQTGLKRVDLRYNRLRQVPAENLSPPADQFETVARINNVTLLEHNLFPEGYWSTFDRYWQDLTLAHPDLLQHALPEAFDSGNPRVAAVRRMYPRYTVQKAREFVWALGEGAEAELTRREQAFNGLQRQLDGWVFSGGGERQPYVLTTQRAVRAGWRDRFIAQHRILSCWRRETPQMLADDGTAIGLELDLSDLNLPSLPDLDADFSHVGSLKLRNMNLDASPEGFLVRHQGVRWLDLSHNQLRELPPALRQMHRLTRLSLNNNRIRLTAESADSLSSRTTLRGLVLNNNPLGVTPDFSQMTDLRSLGLEFTGIETWPTGLGEQPQLDSVFLRGNRISTLPDALIAPSDEQLVQTLRVTRVTNLAGNPLSAETQQRVRAYGARLREARLASAEHPNLLVSSALGEVITPAARELQAVFQRWASGLSAEQAALRSSQWAALREVSGSDGFFEMLRDLDQAGAGHQDLQRRVWEVIDGITANSTESEQLRKEMFEWAGRATCCDRAVLTFSHLEVRLLVYKAKSLALDATQGQALVKLSRALFRLDEVEKIALTDTEQRRTAINARQELTAEQKDAALEALEEVEIRLAYREGLKDRLDLPGQVQAAKFTFLGNVTQAMLDDAYRRVILLDNSAQELESLLARGFWRDFVANKYRSRFEAQNVPHQERMAQMQRDFESGALSQAAYDAQVADLQAQFAIEEAQLIQTLTRAEVAEALMPRSSHETLVYPHESPAGLQLSQAKEVTFSGKRYFVASMPDAGDGEHYLLWAQAPDNPLVLVRSGIIAKPNIAGVWKRRGLAGGMKTEISDDEFEDAQESMPVAPYTAAELSFMRRVAHFVTLRNVPGSYNRANNGKYPLRDYQGRPMLIRKMDERVTLESGAQYTSEQVKPYVEFEGYERVAARYEQKLQLRKFTVDDVKVPGEQALVGQSMVVANRRIASGEIVGVYGGTVLPEGFSAPGGQTYAMVVGKRPYFEGGKLKEEAVQMSGDNIISRINTHFDYDANGKPIRQAAAGYNVEAVAFNVEADMWLGVGEGATTKRKPFILTAVFATEAIAAGVELRLDYQYTESMIKKQFP